jgi:hypothetical protein
MEENRINVFQFQVMCIIMNVDLDSFHSIVNRRNGISAERFDYEVTQLKGEHSERSMKDLSDRGLIMLAVHDHYGAIMTLTPKGLEVFEQFLDSISKE